VEAADRRPLRPVGPAPWERPGPGRKSSPGGACAQRPPWRILGVNCASLPRELVESTLFGHKKGAFTGATSDSDGFFAQAQDGTLFLDEVGELPAHQQAKLLRVLENHEYLPVGSTRVVQSNARIIAASNADLDVEIASGGFRADFYARLAGTVIRLPPLRSRRRDILALAESFLSELAPGEVFRLSAGAAEKLVLHPWPHSVRERAGCNG
jgi:transcriptional regulator with GAF, ATPase, and Fis domain